MVRTVLAVLSLLLLSPTLVAETNAVPLEGSQACRATFVPLDLPGCRVGFTGAATFAGCDGNACAIDVAAVGGAVGLPAGVQALEVYVAADVHAVVCSASRTTLESDAFGCEGAATVPVTIPGACRMVVVGATATADGVVGASAFHELRVCKDGGVVSP